MLMKTIKFQKLVAVIIVTVIIIKIFVLIIVIKVMIEVILYSSKLFKTRFL